MQELVKIRTARHAFSRFCSSRRPVLCGELMEGRTADKTSSRKREFMASRRGDFPDDPKGPDQRRAQLTGKERTDWFVCLLKECEGKSIAKLTEALCGTWLTWSLFRMVLHCTRHSSRMWKCQAENVQTQYQYCLSNGPHQFVYGRA